MHRSSPSSPSIGLLFGGGGARSRRAVLQRDAERVRYNVQIRHCGASGMVMVDVGQRIQVDCQPLSGMGMPTDLQPPAGSCGLDFWQSAPAILWLGRFLHAEPALITIQDGARRAGLCCLLRRLPFGAVLASAYPYAAVTGDEGLFWQNGAAVAAALRAKRVLRL